MHFTIKDALREVFSSSNYILVRPKFGMSIDALRQYDRRNISLSLNNTKSYEAKLDVSTKTITIHDHGLISDPLPIDQFKVESELNSFTDVIIDKIVAVALFFTVVVVTALNFARKGIKKKKNEQTRV